MTDRQTDRQTTDDRQTENSNTSVPYGTFACFAGLIIIIINDNNSNINIGNNSRSSDNDNIDNTNYSYSLSKFSPNTDYEDMSYL